MTLRVIPDIYRLNGRQREALLVLYEAGELSSPVTVSRLTRGRVMATDRAHRAYELAEDGGCSRPDPR